jgi:hypothetical protein
MSSVTWVLRSPLGGLMAEQVIVAESSRVYALLPPEAWFKVLENLGPVDLIRLKLVCILSVLENLLRR